MVAAFTLSRHIIKSVHKCNGFQLGFFVAWLNEQFSLAEQVEKEHAANAQTDYQVLAKVAFIKLT